MTAGYWRHGSRPYRTVASGFVGGVAAHLVGFAVIYLRTAGSLSADDIETIGGLGELGIQIDPPGVWQVVGWLYYAAHNVDVMLEVSGLGRSRTGRLPLTEGILWERWFVLVPIVTLLAAGFVLAFVGSAPDLRGAILTGSSVAVGYATLAVAGVVVTAWDITVSYGSLSASGSVSPDPLWGVLLAGILYPILLGGLGGAVARTVTHQRNDRNGR
ncbi:hypothetical protein [Halorhabdus rudnickae]|uniref:hypothetical protein n=1 Tax=Halorhabdus rudnickae TaxID=1775544 RepID=UPI001082489A|nr:hypothetical protein [Halorhabdus rudnickae]